jgi:(R)-2-hydroxyacyl-CoA dehydratese activating ATPase
MTITAGIDVGSTYTKAVLLNDKDEILARYMVQTGFKLADAARRCYDEILASSGIRADQVEYLIATGFGRHQVDFKDLHVTDLTASARGASLLFPGTRSILDVGGQTMKAIRVEEGGRVKSFRLNDKCAAGTGAFLEKTARYMGYETKDIGPLLQTSREPVEISGVCAVFAESEVINQLSLGTAPSEIMQGAIESLTGRSVQLMKRVKAEPEYTLIGGIMRFPTMPTAVRERTKGIKVNLPGEERNDVDLPQFVTALGAAVLGHRRLEKLAAEKAVS